MTLFSSNCKIVIALSSLFAVYMRTHCSEVSDLNALMVLAKEFKFNVFPDDLAKILIESVLGRVVSDNEFADVQKHCRGIPGLLVLCGMEDYEKKISLVRTQEFRTVIRFMNNSSSLVSWKDEITLLIAAKHGMTISSVGLVESCVQNLFLFSSQLVQLNDNYVPVLFYPKDDRDEEYLQVQLRELWESSRTILPTDNESVMGFFFRMPHSSHHHQFESKSKKVAQYRFHLH